MALSGHAIHAENVRFEGKSGHDPDVTRCLLMTHSGQTQLMARCRQWHRNNEHSDITCCAVLDVKLVKPAPLRADRYFCEIETVGHDGSDGRHAALKIPECCASPTIACDLIVMIAGEAKRKCLREMLDERPLNVEFGAGRVVGVGVFAVKGKAHGGGQLQAHLGVEPRYSASCVKGRVFSPRI